MRNMFSFFGEQHQYNKKEKKENIHKEEEKPSHTHTYTSPVGYPPGTYANRQIFVKFFPITFYSTSVHTRETDINSMKLYEQVLA